MDALRRDHPPICIEKLRIALRTMAATEGEPMILRRAKVFANVLREIPIFIEEDTLIAGSGASQPMGLEIDPEYFLWSQDEIDALKREGFLISPEDERELVRGVGRGGIRAPGVVATPGVVGPVAGG